MMEMRDEPSLKLPMPVIRGSITSFASLLQVMDSPFPLSTRVKLVAGGSAYFEELPLRTDKKRERGKLVSKI
jgi:hypothetical protein